MVGSQVAESYASGVAPTAFPPIPGQNDPATSGRSVMHLRIKASTVAGGRPFSIDIGQTIEFYAEGLTVELVAPQGTVVVNSQLGQPSALPPPAIGLLFTSYIGLRLEKIETSRALPRALFTQTRYIAANETADLQVPTAAQRLTLYSESSVSPVMRWRRDILDLGVVDWDPLRPRLEVDVPSATTLRILAVPSTRLFTLVWTIVP